MFRIKDGEDYVFNEPVGVAGIRVAVQGTRFIVCARSTDIVEFLKHESAGKEKEAANEVFTLDATADFLEKKLPTRLKDFMKSYNIWQGTAGPSDVVFVPGHFTIYESYMNKVDL